MSWRALLVVAMFFSSIISLNGSIVVDRIGQDRAGHHCNVPLQRRVATACCGAKVPSWIVNGPLFAPHSTMCFHGSYIAMQPMLMSRVLVFLAQACVRVFSILRTSIFLNDS